MPPLNIDGDALSPEDLLVLSPEPASMTQSPGSVPVLGALPAKSPTSTIPAGQPSPLDGVGDMDFEIDAEERSAAKIWEEIETTAKKAAAASPASTERVAKPGQEKRFSQLETAGLDFDLRSAVGQRWSAYLKANPTEAKTYKSINCPGSTAEQKREFRKRWAEKQLCECSELKFFRESWSSTLREVSEYMSFDMVLKNEGGRKSRAAWSAAKKYLNSLCAIKVSLAGSVLKRTAVEPKPRDSTLRATIEETLAPRNQVRDLRQAFHGTLAPDLGPGFSGQAFRLCLHARLNREVSVPEPNSE